MCGVSFPHFTVYSFDICNMNTKKIGLKFDYRLMRRDVKAAFKHLGSARVVSIHLKDDRVVSVCLGRHWGCVSMLGGALGLS